MLRYTGPLMIVSLWLAGCGSMGLQSECSWREPCPESVDPVEYLKVSGCFRIGAVGVGGRTPPEETALHRLIAQPDATDCLRRLYHEGTRAGRLYALVGLYYIDREEYRRLASGAGAGWATVDTQAGCICRREAVRHIVGSIEAGEFDSLMQPSLQDHHKAM